MNYLKFIFKNKLSSEIKATKTYKALMVINLLIGFIFLTIALKNLFNHTNNDLFNLILSLLSVLLAYRADIIADIGISNQVRSLQQRASKTEVNYIYETKLVV